MRLSLVLMTVMQEPVPPQDVPGQEAVPQPEAAATSEPMPGPSEYLEKEIAPALLPILMLMDKLRPTDPVAFLAVHLLKFADKHKSGSRE